MAWKELAAEHFATCCIGQAHESATEVVAQYDAAHGFFGWVGQEPESCGGIDDLWDGLKGDEEGSDGSVAGEGNGQRVEGIVHAPVVEPISIANRRGLQESGVTLKIGATSRDRAHSRVVAQRIHLVLCLGGEISGEGGVAPHYYRQWVLGEAVAPITEEIGRVVEDSSKEDGVEFIIGTRSHDMTDCRIVAESLQTAEPFGGEVGSESRVAIGHKHQWVVGAAVAPIPEEVHVVVGHSEQTHRVAL